MYIKSPLNYTGGKYQLLPLLIQIFPKQINTFVDLFAGGFNVGVNVEAKKIICNDHINYLIEMYKYFQQTSEQELLNNINNRIKSFQLTQENVTGYNDLREAYNNNKNSLDLFLLTCYAFNHQIRFNNNQKFNSPFGKDRSSYNKRIEENLILFSRALKRKNVHFTINDFMNVDIDSLDSNDFVYSDPPYLISTGSYNDGNRGFKNWTEKEELQLLALLDKVNKRGVNFALSNVLRHKGNENKILNDWCKKYYITYLDKKYSNCSYHLKNKNTETVEVVITNYQPQGDRPWQQQTLF